MSALNWFADFIFYAFEYYCIYSIYARGGGGGGGGEGGEEEEGGGEEGEFNNQTGPILVHIYPLFNNNVHVKYRSNLIRIFWVEIKNVKNIK